MKELSAWVETHFPKIREDLFTLLRFKTMSADPELLEEHKRCTEWLKSYFVKLGCKAEIIQTIGLPLVYAEDLSAGSNAPTLLIYGHYDVQPIDPIELWTSPPFEPVERHGSVYARGALDDKGQMFYALTALRALRETNRTLAVNLKFCIEGEEECGSRGLGKAIPALKQKLKADSLLVVDFGLLDQHTPSNSMGARGIVTMDLLLRGSSVDLHSGEFGGIAYNPNRALAELIAKCWDRDGRVAIPHFYDDVEEISSEERHHFAGAFSKEMVEEAGVNGFGSERGYSLAEANWLRPTLEINGMEGGYSGPGFKTVIPSVARAKISCRLVPHQDPQKIGRLVEDFLRKAVKKGIEIQIEVHPGGGQAFRGRADSPLALAVAKAYEEQFHKPCLATLSGGSIPVIAELVKAIGAEVVGMGYGLTSDNIHAPNEHFGLDRFKKGIVTVARIIEYLGGA